VRNKKKRRPAQRSVRDEPRGIATETLETVARQARVSTATVSRYFNSPDVVSARTAARIREVVDRTGYTPNLLAGGLASSRSRLIAIAMPRISQPLYSSTIQAVADALVNAGNGVLLGLTGAANEHVERQLQSIVGRRPDGIILAGTPLSESARSWLRSTGVSTIEIWDLPADPVDLVVGFSHAKVGSEIARYALHRGRRKALLISADGAHARQRRDAFMRTYANAGAPEPVVAMFHQTVSYRQGRNAVALHLDSGGTPDVIVCSSDWSAHGASDELLRRKRNVPGDVAVVGFGDLEFAGDLEPALTTVRIDGDAIGRQIVQFLMQRAQNKRIASPAVDIGFAIVTRESG
jgi:LacI family gluconate utilization system Gnt-I transcriptional repressor